MTDLQKAYTILETRGVSAGVYLEVLDTFESFQRSDSSDPIQNARDACYEWDA